MVLKLPATFGDTLLMVHAGACGSGEAAGECLPRALPGLGAPDRPRPRAGLLQQCCPSAAARLEYFDDPGMWSKTSETREEIEYYRRRRR